MKGKIKLEFEFMVALEGESPFWLLDY